MRIHEKRIEKCKKLMAQSGFDLVILFPSPNMYYFSGFKEEPGERMLLLLIPIKNKPVFIASELYQEHIRRDSSIQNVQIWKDSDSPRRLLQNIIKGMELKYSKVLIDDTMGALFLLPLQKILQDCEFVPASKIISSLRIRKSETEIENMKRASLIVDGIFNIITKMKIKGMTELELAARMEYEMKKMGSGNIAFETIVASGTNSAVPHHRAGNRIIKEGDVVVLDYGCKVNGYCSDITRTIICGKPSDKVRKVYDIVQRAQEKAFQAVKSGVAVEEIDRIAREEISKEGFDNRFIHRTGHGIGLEVHEEPYIVEGNNLKLEEGMTFSIEPGIYLPGEFGIRIEDIVLVTSKGGKRLNKCSHELKT